MKQTFSQCVTRNEVPNNWYENLIALQQDGTITPSKAFYYETYSRFLQFGKLYFFDRHDWDFWVAKKSGSLESFAKSNFKRRLAKIRRITPLKCYEDLPIRAVLGSVNPNFVREHFISPEELIAFTKNFIKVFHSDIADKATLENAKNEWEKMYGYTLQRIAGAITAKAYETKQKKYRAFLNSFINEEGQVEVEKYALFHVLYTGDLTVLN
jgi:hypothetical protein